MFTAKEIGDAVIRHMDTEFSKWIDWNNWRRWSIETGLDPAWYSDEPIRVRWP